VNETANRSTGKAKVRYISASEVALSGEVLAVVDCLPALAFLLVAGEIGRVVVVDERQGRRCVRVGQEVTDAHGEKAFDVEIHPRNDSLYRHVEIIEGVTDTL